MMEGAFASGIAGTVAVLLLSVPAIISHLRNSKAKKSEIYEDEDGKATEESIKAFSTTIPRILLTFSTIAGFAIAVLLAVFSTVGAEHVMFLENWLNVAQWALILLQTTSIAFTKDSVKAFDLGLYSALSSIVLLAVLLYQDGLLLQSSHRAASDAELGFRISQLVIVVLTAGASMSLPRRPVVFIDEKPVDGMFTESAFSRYTFGWLTPILNLAREKKRLELSDLPKMDHLTRAKDLSDDWVSKKHPHKLWIEIFLAYKFTFILQWFMTLLQSFGNFAPQFVIFQILKLLEQRVKGQPASSEAWIWIAALTIATIGAAWIEHWLFWISWSQIAIPIRSQLAAQIFQKALRRKDVKGASKSSKKPAATEGKDIAEATSEAVGEAKPEVEEEEDSDPKGKQSTVNLIGVDCKRVSDFASFNNYFAGSFFKLIVSFAFLLSIIGWKALLCGFAAMSLTIPLNIYFSKRYSAAQDRLMKVRDAKMGVVTEALQGIRQIKFSALETNWHAKIGKVRTKELEEQWNVYVSDTFLLFCWIMSPIALAATSLAVYALLYGELTPSVAFTSIGVFGSLEVTLSVIPELTTDLIDAWISIERIEKYLAAPEVIKNTNDAPNISFEDAQIAWPSDEQEDSEDANLRYVLSNVNVSFPEKELSVISGKTGTGKSLLLAAILGEVDVLGGKVNVPRPPQSKDRHDHLANKDNWILPSSIAFVSQIPWIENASIKDNILFGLPDDEYRYSKVLEVCALKKDLEMLADGEKTEIGANGINLSGGQRWRVTFARALYSRAGILVLDDIFSAVDAHVGRFIFEQGLTGEMGVGRTRILVTHHVSLVKSRTKYIVELGEGTVENAGLIKELEADGILSKIESHEENEAAAQDDEDPTAVNSEESSNAEIIEPLKKIDSKAPKKFVEEEKREEGRVKFDVYTSYMKSTGGWPFWITALILFGSLQTLVTGRAWWLRLWTGHDEKTSDIHQAMAYSYQIHGFSSNNATHSQLFHTTDSSTESLRYYLGIYVAFSVASVLIGTARYFFIFTGSIRASRRLFDKLCFTILRTPLRWMDTVPLGRILNRFTADFNVVDARLSSDIAFGANNFFRLIGVIIAGVFVSPYVIILSVSLLVICIQIGRQYMAGGREVKRIESNAKSPIFETFGSALTGVGTIRAFDKSEVYITRMFARIDEHTTSYWHLWAFNRWMGWRMGLVGGFFATVVASMILLIKDIDASLAGFALSFALEYGNVVIWTIRHYTNLELDMNAAERIMEYSNLPTESQEGVDPPAHWPSEGRVEVSDLVVSYAPDLPPVLKGLTFSVARNERIGVVGRTGAGKSSLTLALFRFLEAQEGSIYIDGLDISKIKLQALRSRLAIIPQDPVLFSGTVRSNLDAFDEHTDSELRDALQRVHLISEAESATITAHASGSATPVASSPSDPSSSTSPTVTDLYKNLNKNPFTSLLSAISEGGLNLSQGQRQLLCLARAIVSRPKVMVLDEATSAVDMATDALIQRSIREEFNDSTLIVIAHRLSTIADFDKILVLGEGKVVEFGTPSELYGKKDGVFRSMVGESGEKEKLESIIVGEK